MLVLHFVKFNKVFFMCEGVSDVLVSDTGKCYISIGYRLGARDRDGSIAISKI